MTLYERENNANTFARVDPLESFDIEIKELLNNSDSRSYWSASLATMTIVENGL
jgi:hypothetical protein